jgi:hypothetical protein
MKSPRLLLPALIAAFAASITATGADGWVSLFDGQTLNGWKASENPGSPQVRDGAIVAEGKRAHLFYVGEDGRAEFENFELELEIKTEPGANSGVYFHTKWQDSGWPAAGFEAQVNNTQAPFKEQDYRENKKTGSLYGIRNVYKSVVKDGEWFVMNIRVQRPRVQIWLNRLLVVDYTEPANPVLPSPGPKLNLLGKGTFALQCHDEESRAYYRNIRVRRLPPGEDTSVAKPVFSEQDLARIALGKDNFPLVDLHAIPENLMPLDVRAVRLQTGITPGLVSSDPEAMASLAVLPERRHEPFFRGLRVGVNRWWERISPEERARPDYIICLADAFQPPGDDPQAVGDRMVAQLVEAMDQTPIDVLAQVMLLNRQMAPYTGEVWNEERQQRIIEAAVRNGVALEINPRLRIPSLDFVRRAKAAGAKFTIGSGDAATAGSYTDWAYLLEIQKSAGLGWRDMWVPGHFPTRAQKALLRN